MLLVRGWAGDTALTGTIYEEGEQAPEYSGSPDTEAPFVWICDEFYEVDSGGSTQFIDGEEIRIAFESPMPRGFDSREQAVAAAREHLKTQFARLGVAGETVDVTVQQAETA